MCLTTLGQTAQLESEKGHAPAAPHARHHRRICVKLADACCDGGGPIVKPSKNTARFAGARARRLTCIPKPDAAAPPNKLVGCCCCDHKSAREEKSRIRDAHARNNQRAWLVSAPNDAGAAAKLPKPPLAEAPPNELVGAAAGASIPLLAPNPLPGAAAALNATPTARSDA